MKKALLDTNILSYFLRGNPLVVEKIRLYHQHYSYLSFSVFTYYEIKSGLLYKDAQRQMQRFDRLAEISEVIPYDRAIADTASQIYANLRKRGLLITPIDLFIAATAVYGDYRLITANIKHFQNIPNLNYEDWSV
jgi:tRNA(fMet)-specific endonuclease VapC